MDLKKMDASETTVTRDNGEIDAATGNIYESIGIISKRAKQISVQLKRELDEKLMEFSSNVDNLEEIFENREQIEISKYYERLPKPLAYALEEYMTGNTYHRKPGEEIEETSTK